jgi:hypothetical protein
MADAGRRVEGMKPDGETVTAILSKPARTPGHNEWISTVHCPALFSSDKQVAGADAGQALDLAEMLVNELFDHHGIGRRNPPAVMRPPNGAGNEKS